MSYGISIQNQQGLIQIDENYSNYQLYSSGIRATNGLNFPDTPFVTPKNSLLLIRPVNYESNIHYVCDKRKYSDRCEYSILALGPTSFQSSGKTPYARTYYYLLFVDSAYQATQSNQDFGYGLNVYKSDNTLAFSTNIKTVPFIQNTYISANTSQSINISGYGNKTTYVEVSGLGRYGYTDIFNGFNYDSLGLYHGIRFPSNSLAYYDPIQRYEGNDVYGGYGSTWFTPNHLNFGAF